MQVLTVASVAFETVGLVVAFVGFNMTLGRTSPGKSLLPLVLRRTTLYVRERAVVAWARLRRKPRNVTVHASGMASSVSMTTGAAVGYASLPSVREHPEAFMEALNEKLQKMMLAAASVKAEVDRVEKDATRRADQISEDVEAKFRRLAEDEQRETERDLILQFWGWFMIVIGVILGGIAAAM